VKFLALSSYKLHQNFNENVMMPDFSASGTVLLKGFGLRAVPSWMKHELAGEPNLTIGGTI